MDEVAAAFMTIRSQITKVWKRQSFQSQTAHIPTGHHSIEAAALCQIITAEIREATGRSFHGSYYDMNNGVQFFVLAWAIHQPELRVFTHWCTVCYKHWIIERLSQLTFPGKQIHSSHLVLLGSAPLGCLKKRKRKERKTGAWTGALLTSGLDEWPHYRWRGKEGRAGK